MNKSTGPTTAAIIIKSLHSMSDSKIASHSKRFFKTGKGEYGESDRFIGVRMPRLRQMAKHYRYADLSEVLTMLKSEIHEARMLALLIMVLKFESGSKDQRAIIYEQYLANTQFINNWDLVDCSAMYIVGPHLHKRDRSILYRLAQSRNLWERRIAMFSCFYFIRQNDFDDALAIAEVLLKDEQDLIHKVVGWMLREIGKREMDVERGFLQEHYRVMPRTMLRYAIEKFDEAERQAYLKGTA